MKKILLGIGYFILFFIALNILIAIVTVFYYQDNYSSFQEGYKYGAELGTNFRESGGRLLLIIIAASISGILTYKGILPGTQEKENKPVDKFDNN